MLIFGEDRSKKTSLFRMKEKRFLVKPAKRKCYPHPRPYPHSVPKAKSLNLVISFQSACIICFVCQNIVKLNHTMRHRFQRKHASPSVKQHLLHDLNMFYPYPRIIKAQCMRRPQRTVLSLELSESSGQKGKTCLRST